EPPDLDTLSRRCFDLWQRQITALASDPEIAEMAARFYALVGAPLAAMAGTAKWDGNDGTADPAAGSPAAFAPPRGDDDALAELAQRVAALEERLARLEAGPRSGGTKPRRRARGGPS